MRGAATGLTARAQRSSTRGNACWRGNRPHRALLRRRRESPQNGPRANREAPLEKRADYLSWDEYFMGVAMLSAQRSKDPNTQVGACIVDPRNKIVGVGYNGFPTGCSDDLFPWDREGDFLQTKYPYICHAELNAVINRISAELYGCRLYVALFPCNECAKVIIQSGIREVVYLSDKYADTDPVRASRRMFEAAGVQCRRLESRRRALSVPLSVGDE
jgi:dCMP deaminase